MKILITGCNGMLGWDLHEALKEKHELFLSDIPEINLRCPEKNKIVLDITDVNKTYETISRINPELVIHTAAMSDVDGCERNPLKAFAVNSSGTRNIAVACQRFDTVLCYISTDYIFSGENTPREGYSEMDSKDPRCVYGKSKYQGEFFVKHLLNKFYIVRSSSLFGRKRANFVSMIAKMAIEGKPLKVVRDQYTSPTYTRDLAGAISVLIEKPVYGTYHLTNSEGTGRQEVAGEVLKILGKSIDIKLVKRQDIFFANRPKDSRLQNFMWQAEGFKPLRSWKNAVREYMEEIKGELNA